MNPLWQAKIAIASLREDRARLESENAELKGDLWNIRKRYEAAEAQLELAKEALKAALATHGDHYSWGPQALAVLNGDNHD